MKYFLLIAFLSVVLTGCFDAAPEVTGCCQVGNTKCASGQGVTEDYCEYELDGDFCDDQTCNTDTGQCE